MEEILTRREKLQRILETVAPESPLTTHIREFKANGGSGLENWLKVAYETFVVTK